MQKAELQAAFRLASGCFGLCASPPLYPLRARSRSRPALAGRAAASARCGCRGFHSVEGSPLAAEAGVQKCPWGRTAVSGTMWAFWRAVGWRGEWCWVAGGGGES